MTAFAATPVRTLRGTLQALRLNLIVAAQYRANLLVWMVVSVLQTVVYLSVWSAVAAASGGSSSGFTSAQFAGYFIVLLVLQQTVTSVSIVGEFSGYVRRGTLSIHLLRPLHPFAYVLGGMLAFRVQFILMVPIVATALFLAFDAEVDTSAAAVAVAIALVPLGVVAKVMCDGLVACTSLWLTRIDGLRGLYMLVILLMSGQFAPLAVMPEAMQLIAKALPFYWMLGFPTELVIGRAQLADAWIAIAVLSAWSIAFYVILQPVWRAGTRAYEAAGT